MAINKMLACNERECVTEGDDKILISDVIKESSTFLGNFALFGQLFALHGKLY